MADNETSREDKQLAPSQRKLDKARSEGSVPRSRDVGHAFVLGTALIGLMVFGPRIGASTLDMLRGGLVFTRRQAIDPTALTQWLGNLAASALWVIVPCALVLMTVGVLASGIPGGFHVSMKPASFNFAKVNPMSGLARIFSRESAVDLVRLFALAALMVVVSAWFAVDHFAEFAALASSPLQVALGAAHSSMTSGLGLLVGLLVLSAAIDVPLQWWRHYTNLKMTLQEARDEARQSDGDPMIKSRIRQRQREISRGRMLAAVPAADVVITNPTHYAVAIRYDEAAMGAPRVVAKGADHLAARIRELAMDAGVPLFEAPPLARALYAHVDVDREIPSTLYTAVAQVLAYVFQLRRHVPGRGAFPQRPDELPVPADMDPKRGVE